MNAFVDKYQVEKQFSRAASSYDAAAIVQKKMSDQLIQYVDEHLKNKPVSAITDLGCGTGLSLYKLSKKYPKATYTAVDISKAMLEKTSTLLPGINLIHADMEEYLPNTHQDLIFSNASIQWCDFEEVLEKVRRSLKANGILAFSSFGPLTHIELAKSWQAVDGHEHRINFMDIQEHTDKLKEAGFTVLERKSETHQLNFENTADLLSSIKQTGATNAAKNRVRGLLGKERYERFIQELNKIKPLILSYETLSFLAQKKQ